MISDLRSARGPTPRPATLVGRLGVTVVIPVLAYVLLRPQVGSDAAALAIAGAVPAAWTLARFAWQRRVDPIGVLAVAGFGIALPVAALSGGNSLLLKVRDAPLIGVIGVAFLLSAAVRKPLLPLLLRLLGRDGQAPSRRLTQATVIVGATLIVDAVTRLTLALTLQTSTFLAVNHEVSWSIVGSGLALLWLTGRHVALRSSDPVTEPRLRKWNAGPDPTQARDAARNRSATATSSRERSR
jgi:hypothetical protein